VWTIFFPSHWSLGDLNIYPSEQLVSYHICHTLWTIGRNSTVFKNSGIWEVRQSGDPLDSLVSSEFFPPTVHWPATLTRRVAGHSHPLRTVTPAHDGSNVSEYLVHHLPKNFAALWAILINRAIIPFLPHSFSPPFVFTPSFAVHL